MYERCAIRLMQVVWHNERMRSEEFLKKVYVTENVGPNSGGRPLGRWKDKVKKYMCERDATRGGGTDHARRVFGLGEVEALLPKPTLEGHSLRERGIRAID